MARPAKPRKRIAQQPKPAPEKKPTGRPKKAIDPQQVKTMASYGCTVAEIAAVLKCSKDTLERRFATQLQEGRNARNGMLRVKQFKLADKSAAMAIFLGKNYLGQRDAVRYERLTDDELLARARDAGIDVGTPGKAASPAGGDESTEPTN